MAVTSQLDAELNKRLLDLISGIGKNNAILQETLRQQARNIIGAQKDIVAEYEDQLDRARTWNGKEAQEAKARLLRLKTVEIQRTAFMQQQTEKLKQYQQERAILEKETKLANDRVNKALQTHGTNTAQYNQALVQHTKLLDRLTKAKKEEFAHIQSTRATNRIMRGAAREREQIEADQLKATTKWGQAFRHGLSETMIGGLNKLFGGVTLTSVIANAATKINSAVEAGAKSGGYGIELNPFIKASSTNFAALGLNTTEAIKAMAEHRRTIMSTSSGLNEWVGGLNSVREKFGDSLIDPLERTKLAMSKFETVTAAGIRIRAEDATSYGDEMRKTSKLTGMTYQEFSNSINEIIKDDAIQQQLKAATNEQERRSIMDGIAQQFAQNKAMGLTTQQAMGAAKALGRLAGEGPLERFRKAAKIRAMGAAMGMGGDANRAADILQLGNRATKEQKEEMQNILGKLSEVVTQTGTGSLSAEIFADTLATKLDLKSIVGAQSEFNTTLAKAVAPLTSAADTLAVIPGYLTTIVERLNTAKSAVVNNDILMAAGGAAGALLLPKMLKMVPSLLGMSGGGAALSATAGGAGAAATGAGGALAGVTATGLAAAVSVALAGTALTETVVKAVKGEDDISNYISRFTTNTVGNMFQGIDDLGVSMKHMMGMKTDQEEEESKLQAALEKRKAWLANQATVMTKPPASSGVLTTDSNKDSKKEQTTDTEKQEADRQKSIQIRTKQIDTTNETLKKLAENSDKQLELAEKQLIIMTLTEQEKELAKTSLRRDNRFGSQHGYI